MKICVSSYSFSKYKAATNCSYSELCDKAKVIGFDGIEFIDLVSDNALKTAHEIKEHCRKIGLEIVAYTVGADLLNRNSDEEYDRLCGCVDVCEALGAKLMRHDLCYGSNSDGSFDYETAMEKMVPLIRRVTEYAKSKGIRTCSENHGYIFQAPIRVKALIEKVNNPNYGWLCDMGNFLCDDCEPLDSVKIALPYTIHVHAKDFYYQKGGDKPDGSFPSNGGNWLTGTVVGRGYVPVKDCVEIFKKAGYNGCLSLEFEGPEDCISAIEEGFKFLKSLI